jgi:uncharacterized membrane protein (DUF4010 family)
MRSGPSSDRRRRAAVNFFNLQNALPPELISFAATVLLAFTVGLELHSYRRTAGEPLAFGTTRTLTLIAALGYVLYDLGGWAPYLAGFAVLGLWLGLFYWRRLAGGNEHLLTLLVALSPYLFGPLAQRGPPWLLILYAVVIILMLAKQPDIRRLSDTLRSNEATTLAKFLIMAGLVLPLLPDRPIAPFVAVSWSQLWLAVVVVSGISYLSYLAQTYFFPERGVLLTGLLGGLYSSTAVTVVLGRRARGLDPQDRRVAAAVVLATMMMYLRLWLLIFVLGYHAMALRLALPFAAMIVASAAAAWAMERRSLRPAAQATETALSHPLEFSTALLFAFLFVFFAALSTAVIDRFGASGLRGLAFAAGLTDIDPFILSVLAGRYHVGETAIQAAVVIASGSNNLLKAAYGMGLSRHRGMLPAALWLTATFLLSMAYAFWISAAG